VGWIGDGWHDVTNAGSGTWLTVAAWAAVVALVYVSRQLKRNGDLKIEQMRPHVAMFVEPHAADWHVVELVVRNFGQTAAFDIEFSFLNPPIVARYENAHGDMIDIGELRLPGELPVLAPGQEWRTVWDSALDRDELGGLIEWRFMGTVTYHDRPEQKAGWRKLNAGRRRSYRTNVVLEGRSKSALINRATEEARHRLRVKQLKVPTNVHQPRREPTPKVEADPNLQPHSDKGTEPPQDRRTGERTPNGEWETIQQLQFRPYPRQRDQPV
jgi:hypothetical protein